MVAINRRLCLCATGFPLSETANPAYVRICADCAMIRLCCQPFERLKGRLSRSRWNMRAPLLCLSLPELRAKPFRTCWASGSLAKRRQFGSSAEFRISFVAPLNTGDPHSVEAAIPGAFTVEPRTSASTETCRSPALSRMAGISQGWSIAMRRQSDEQRAGFKVPFRALERLQLRRCRPSLKSQRLQAQLRSWPALALLPICS